MNRKFLLSVPVVALCVLASFLTGCSSGSNNNNNNNNSNHNPAAIAATSGNGQSATVSAAFSSPLVATVTDSSGNPVSSASVTFTVVAGSSGASASFATGGATDTETTGSNGQATTSQALTANATAGTFTVTAAVSGVSTPATFTFTNTTAPVTSTTYVFYASGTELANTGNGGESYYALAGAVQVDNTTGNVTGGEEDYNDADGITQGGANGAVSITGGSLSVDSTTGQGTLTLVTNSPSVGGGTNPGTGAANPAGTEILGIQFANTDHALIMQFDGTATSSGSLDVQTAASGGGNYSFVLSGVDTNYNPVGYGGVYTTSSGAITGVADQNDGGTVTLASTFTGTAGTPDSFGRGQVTGVTINGTTLTLIYYNVGPEVIRLIDMDLGTGNAGTGGAAVGSAYGQGSTAFTSASLGNSVLGLEGAPIFGFPYATAGSIITSPTSGATTGAFTGTVDDYEGGIPYSDEAISGTYSVSNANSTTNNGYGNLSIASSPLGFVTNLGVYVTDPALNILDPNNTTGGGGALVLDLDSRLSGGTGIMISQTDTTPSDFSGNYAFGAQEFFSVGTGTNQEYDYLGQGAVSSGTLTATGIVSDPLAYFGANPALYSNVAISGTFTPDGAEATNGRYTMSPFTVDVSSSRDGLSINAYQANKIQVLFMEDSLSVGFGSFQQQPASLTGIPGMKSPVKKGQMKTQLLTKSVAGK
jgi:hypothetical protein